MFLLINYCSGMFLLGHLQTARKSVLPVCQVATKAAQTYEFPAHHQQLRVKHVRTTVNH